MAWYGVITVYSLDITVSHYGGIFFENFLWSELEIINEKWFRIIDHNSHEDKLWSSFVLIWDFQPFLKISTGKNHWNCT